MKQYSKILSKHLTAPHISSIASKVQACYQDQKSPHVVASARTKNSAIKISNLGFGMLASVGAGLLASDGAYAACDTHSPSNGQTVTCTQADTVPIFSFANGVTVNIEDGASMSSGQTAAIDLGARTTINNSGTITTASSQDGIRLAGGGHYFVNNAGASIIANDLNKGPNALRLTAPSGVSSTIENYGSIISASQGISTQDFTNIHNYQSGYIAGNNWNGLVFFGGGTLINEGLIEGRNLGAARLHGNGSITNTASGILRNTGTESSFATAGLFTADGGTINNAGLIEGIEYGILTSAGSSDYANIVTNTGTITATGENGVGAYLTYGGSLTNESGGLISGDIGVLVDVDSTTGVIDNYGTITGTGGTGVIFLSSGNKLIMRDGAELNGSAISAEEAGNSIDFYGSGTNASAITNFESLTMQGEDWKLDGAITISGSTSDATHIVSGNLTLTNDLNHSVNGGGVTIDEDATLQLGDGTTGGMVVSGDIVDNGALIFNHSDDISYANIVSGIGTFTQAGSGTLNITSDQTYTGATTVSNGTLALDSTGSLTGNGAITVMNGATLGGFGSTTGDITNDGVIAAGNALDLFSTRAVGNFTSSGSLINNNQIQLGGSNGAGNTLTVAQDYISNDGYLNINTVLGDDSSVTDKLIVGNDTSGNTTVLVSNVGGAGAATLANGIEIVSVGGSSNGTFQLGQRVTAGIYEYDIYQGGVGASTANGNWYLRTLALPVDPDTPDTPAINPESTIYLRNLNAASTMFMHTLHDRLGEPQFTDPYKTDGNNPSSAWVRVVSNHTDSVGGNGQVDLNTDTNLVHLGTDIARWSNDGNDRWIVGVMGAYGQSKIDASAKYFAVTPSGFERNATGKVDGYSVGAYATWYGNKDKPEGAYVDTWAQYGWYDNKVQGNTKAEESYNSRGWTASVEAGYALIAREEGNGRQLMFEPQVQVAYNNFTSDDHTDAGGTRITDNNANGVITRVGARLYGRSTQNDNGIQPFVEANWWYSDAKNSLAFNGVTMSDGTPNSRYELKAGLQGEVAKNWLMWGHAGVQFGSNDFNRYEGMVGIKRMF